MSNAVKIEMVSAADSSLYSRSATSKLISSDNAPSSPPLTIKALQIASGRRKGFEPKNDPEGDRRSERRVASRVPKFEDGELKLPTERFDAVATNIDDDVASIAKSNPRTNGTHAASVEPKVAEPMETPLSPKLRAEYGDKVVQLNVSPLPQRKEPVPLPPPVQAAIPVPAEPAVNNNSSTPKEQPKGEPMKKESSRRELKKETAKEPLAKQESNRRETTKPANSSRRPTKTENEEKREGSPPAGRRSSLTRSPPNSGPAEPSPREVSRPKSRTSESKSKSRNNDGKERSPEERRIAANIHYDYKSVISQPALPEPEVHGPDRHSNRRQNSKPNSRDSKPRRQKKSRSPSPPRKPRDDRPSIRIEGRKATSRDMFESSGSLSAASAPSSSGVSDSSTTETTSRRKIKTRSEALDRKLTEAFPDGEFSPEDDNHLKYAIHTALEESRAKSVQEAIDAGHELNAEVLKSLTRPNAIEEVIETMVSQRREQIREKRASERRQLKSPRKSKVVKGSLTVASRNRSSDEEEDDKKPIRQVKPREVTVNKTVVTKPKTSVKQTVIQDDLDDEAEEETVRPVRRKVKAKTKIASKPVVKKKSVAIKQPDEEDIDDDKAEEDSEGPLIETMEEPDQELVTPVKKAPVKVASPKPVILEEEKLPAKTKAKISINDGTPVKSDLPGTPLLIPTLLKKDQTEQVEQIGGSSSGGVAMKTFRVDEDGEAYEISDEPVKVKKIETEANVKLPRENRKARKSDYMEKADEIGNRDYVYDPLGVDQPFGDEDDSVGDDIYEESSEDDSKLTIAEKKDEMLYRFKLIKEGYPGIALPRITKKMKLAKMVRLYEHVMSRIKLKVKTNNFKIFLVIGFLAMQFAAKKFGADAAGFTINQMTSMKHYEKYLREIGESDFSSFGSELPVMVRLPFFMAVNMGIFLVAKWVFKKTGKDFTAQFHKLYAQLTGGDDYVYVKDEGGTAGLAAGGGGEEAGEGGGGIFGMIKSFLGMMGGGGEGGGGEEKPKRGEAAGPTYKRRKKPADE